jgi:hypothetical protein
MAGDSSPDAGQQGCGYKILRTLSQVLASVLIVNGLSQEANIDVTGFHSLRIG